MEKPLAPPKTMKKSIGFFQFVYPFLTIGVFWEFLVRFGFINLNSLPAPSTLLAALWDLAVKDGILWVHILSSLYRLFIGYSLAVILGTLFGALLAQKKALMNMFGPVLNILMSVPTIAWIPIFLITLGLGDRTVITAIFVSSFFAIAFNTLRGIEMIDRNIINAARMMGLSGIKLFVHVLLPASLLSVINGLRLAIGYAWRALVGGELLAALIERGLGKMVYQARYFNDASVMLVGLLLIGWMGFLIDQLLLTLLERRTVEKWGMTIKK